MSKQPVVSIGIPTYNRHASLKKTIESVLSQTYKNLEILISDNCSTDNKTEKVVKDFLKKDRRIHYYRQEKNQGATRNFQFVLDKSSGDYFMWLADDDWIDNDWIFRCVDFIQNKDFEFSIVSGITRFDDDAVNTRSDIEDLDIILDNKYKRIIKFYKNVQFCNIYYGLIPMKYAKEIKCEHQLADDWLISARMLFSGKSKIINDVYSHRAQGVSKDLVSLGKYHGIKKLTDTNFPFYIAYGASRDILKNPFYKKRISFLKRLIFAVVIYCVIICRYSVIFIKKRI